MHLSYDLDSPADSAGAPGRDGRAVKPGWQDGERPVQWGCTSCMHYDSGCAYCTYIHTPVSILFVCPQVLESRR